MNALAAAFFAISIGAYVIGALIYARVALAEAPVVRRLAFIGTLLIVILIVVSTADTHPWLLIAFPLYVALTIYGWIASAREASRRGVKSTGIARMLIR